MKGEDIARRLLRFAVHVLRLVRKLQRADFAHKVSIAAKELRESRYWLRLTAEASLAAPSAVAALVDEAGELVAILTASAKTAKARL